MEVTERVAEWLTELAISVEKVKQMESYLEQQQTYIDLTIEKARVEKIEDQIRAQLKLWAEDGTVTSSGYEAILVTRHGKGVMHYDLQAIEQEETLKTCITKTVNEKLFKAVVEAKSLDASMFCTPEPGTETKAVTIRQIVVKGGTHEG